MTRRLIVVGAGGLGRETVAAARAANEERRRWEIIGFLDDDPALHGSSVDGLPVLGPAESVADHPDCEVAVCTASSRDPASRARLTARLALPDERYAIVVHPRAALAPGTVVGAGSVVLAGVVTTVALELGAHVVVMPSSVLTHDVVIEEHVTLASGVRVNGRARVRTGAFVGSGVSIREDCTVGAWSLIGMGAAVITDVPTGEVWAGVPARFLRTLDESR